MLWYETPEGQKRLAFENWILSTTFPSFLPFRREKHTTIYVVGVIHSSATRNEYEVRLNYPSDYPYSPPEPFCLRRLTTPIKLPKSRSLEQSPHRYGTGKLCVLNPSVDWFADRCHLGTVIGFTGRWFLAYEYWAMTGRWPGRQH